jgi:shikimate kinase
MPQPPNTPGASTRAEVWAIFLVGFMGAGKTTVGKILAERLGWCFIDLDEAIEAHEERTIAEIFQTSGESEFRRAEVEALRSRIEQLDSAHPAVVALGGGAYAQEPNRNLIKGMAQPAVFLDAGADDLMVRCRNDSLERPLMADENHFRQLYERRRPAYMEADVCIQTGGKPPLAVVDEVIAALNLKLKERLT